MCLLNRKPCEKRKVVGYQIVQKVGKSYYALFDTERSEIRYRKGVRSPARLHPNFEREFQSEPGFHIMASLRNARRLLKDLRKHQSNNYRDIILVQVEGENVYSIGISDLWLSPITINNNYDSYGRTYLARFRTIIEEVE